MSGAWEHRIVKDEKGKLHFAFVRFRPMENKISGMTEPWNFGDDVDAMRKFAKELTNACERSVIDLADGIDHDSGEIDDEYEEEDAWRRPDHEYEDDELSESEDEKRDQNP